MAPEAEFRGRHHCLQPGIKESGQIILYLSNVFRNIICLDMRGSGNKEQFLVGSAGSFPEALFGHIERIGGSPGNHQQGNGYKFHTGRGIPILSPVELTLTMYMPLSKGTVRERSTEVATARVLPVAEKYATSVFVLPVGTKSSAWPVKMPAITAVPQTRIRVIAFMISISDFVYTAKLRRHFNLRNTHFTDEITYFTELIVL